MSFLILTHFYLHFCVLDFLSCFFFFFNDFCKMSLFYSSCYKSIVLSRRGKVGHFMICFTFLNWIFSCLIIVNLSVPIICKNYYVIDFLKNEGKVLLFRHFNPGVFCSEIHSSLHIAWSSQQILSLVCVSFQSVNSMK